MRTPRNEPLGSDISGRRPPRNRAAGAEEATPERKCVLTGRNGSRDELLRLAISPPGPDGNCQVLPDALARAPGRGAWIGVTRAELDEALAAGKLKGALMRAFGKTLSGAKLDIPENLGALAQDALTRALLQRFGLEMRSGRLILGSDRIAQQARSGAVAWLGHAADASEDGCKKLDQAFRVGMDAEGSGLVGERLPLDRAALSVALGRDNVVHLALADRASTERVEFPLRRLMRFTGAHHAAESTSPAGAANGAAHLAETAG
ncbi:MAG TPA: DUF448 domain-containing protein [Sphingomonadaceae bacterium]|nr:DUF448 domain-containing protein [Sphingomonadaceae bacterium]